MSDACSHALDADAGIDADADADADADVGVDARRAPDMSLVLVARLRRIYWPRWIGRLTRPRVLRARPRDYREPEDRLRDRGYDAGRVHFFLQRLRAPRDRSRDVDLDPIHLDTKWHGTHPCDVVLVDGHHRFAAHVLARRRLIPASFAGPVDLLAYLVGERDAHHLW